MQMNKPVESKHLISEMVKSQREFFKQGKSRDLSYRQAALIKLRDGIKRYETEIIEALRSDFQKPAFEAYTTEVGFILDEINHTLKEFANWAQPQKVKTPIRLQPAKSTIHPEPLGVVLIIGPWNYPFQLLVSPLVGAMAAGNCAILKPSEFCPHTSDVLRRLIEESFAADYVTVVEGGVETSQALLEQKFDHIFFTGGTQTGKVVMRAAAEHLTPVTLELGGKSPCIVHSDAPVEGSARRVAWGKFMNAGQTCVAPDYLLVHRPVAARFKKALADSVRDFFGEDPKQSSDFARIVNERHFDRLKNLMQGCEVIFGGEHDRSTRYFAPTAVVAPHFEHPIMKEEIFGPLLPVLEYDDFDQVYAIIEQHEKPLALYLFSEDEKRQDEVLRRVQFGGGCFNDTVLHLANPHLPFGGIGPSGMGAYHGPFSFNTFSHRKGVLTRSFSFDAKFRYAPYADNLKYIRWLEALGG